MVESPLLPVFGFPTSFNQTKTRVFHHLHSFLVSSEVQVLGSRFVGKVGEGIYSVSLSYLLIEIDK